MSDDCVWIAANFLVPRTKEDLAMTTTMLRRMPCFSRLNRFSDLDECKHTIEDEDQVWVQAVFEVPVHRAGRMLQMLGGLPHFGTISLPEEWEVLDEKLSLKFHPKLNGTSKGKEREMDTEGECTIKTSQSDTTAVSAPSGTGEASMSSTSNDRGNRNKGIADETMAIRTESEQSDQIKADISIENDFWGVRQCVLQPQAKAARDELVVRMRAANRQLYNRILR
ncbi:transcription factor [Pseudozyma hubeiensis SY62]|uniref:Transcription factor n=1 Tax=Pseudozyma hubeiensis (strain SY62) TaxID=1305764 RepID=R9P9Z8_PSEHS|nr:transcription factor [Pseudozyma hubeiensis SY62]GAC98179.1 transcription factor [Pseudozyma hubeiensis SY62]